MKPVDLNQRRSTPSRLLSEPGPNAEQLDNLLTVAMRVPDHGRLAPWRFIVLSGAARHAFAALTLARFGDAHPHASEAALEKERLRFLYAPVIVAVVACVQVDHKIPQIEQLMSGGALCFNILQAAEAMGFAAQWLTGWAAYDTYVLSRLGVVEHEQLIGYLHIGTATAGLDERQRPDLASRLQRWTG